MQHLLGGCACRQYTTAAEGYVRRAPTLTDLRADLLAALPASLATAVRDVIACATTRCPESVRAGFMPLFLDPVLFLGQRVSSTAASLASRYVAVYVDAMLARETLYPSQLEALRLPGESGVARASPLCAIDWALMMRFGCTPIPQLPARPLPPPLSRPAGEGARPKLSGYGAIDDQAFFCPYRAAALCTLLVGVLLVVRMLACEHASMLACEHACKV